MHIKFHPDKVCKDERRTRVIDHRNVVSKHDLENMNNQITCLHKIRSLSATCNNERNEIAYLQNEVQQLEGYVSGLKSNNQQKLDEPYS
jgi:cell division protein FtsB